MNPHVAWRLDLARDLTARLRRFPDLRDVLTETLELVKTMVPQLDPRLTEPDRYELDLAPTAYERPVVLGRIPLGRSRA